MYLDYGSLFFVLMASLVAGLLLGRAWWYITSRDEKILKSKVVRGSSSYLLGMNYLISNQPDLAIMELSRAARQDPEAVEVQIVLGNLYREKGQSERAIQIHKTVMERKGISPSERNLAQFCLGLDYKKSGFVDRSIENFEELLQVDRGDERVFEILIKLYDEVGHPEKAYKLQQELIRLQRTDDFRMLALLEVQMGKKYMELGDLEMAEKRFRRAIDLDAKSYPAYMYYGDLYLLQNKAEKAVDQWEQMVRSNYKRSHLVFQRLHKAYADLNQKDKMSELLEEVIKKDAYGWRARIFLAHLKEQESNFEEAYDLLKEAARLNPHSLAIHQRVWQLFSSNKLSQAFMHDYVSLTEEKIFFLDPFICLECGYRTTEYLWKCPHCHSYESFVEARI